MKYFNPAGFFIIFVLTLITTMAHAKPTIRTDLPLKYLEQAPKDPKNKPLIIFIHGYGTNEEDLFHMNKDFLPDYTYLSVRAPMNSPYAGRYQWFSLSMPTGGLFQIAKEVNDHTKLLVDFINKAAKKYETDSEKIILVGFSQGAIMSYEVALNNPTLVRGIVALSGAMLPVVQSKMTSGYDLKNLAVFIGHGTSDNRVPYEGATSAFATLSKTSIKPVFKTYQGLGHSINQTELKDINQWMQETISSPRVKKESVIYL